MKNYKSLTYLINTFWLVLCLTIFVFFYYNYKSDVKNYPKAEKGELDLTQWDFQKDGIIPLIGQWEFYYNKLLSPDDFKNDESLKYTTLVTLPGSFIKNTSNIALPNKGFGTYKLRVKTNSENVYYALKTEFIHSSHKLWVENHLVTYTGKVGESKSAYNPQLLPKVGSFTNENKEFDIILQTANYDANTPQIDTILLGSEEQIIALKSKRLAFDLFIFGSSLIIGIYNLALYNKRKKDRSTLFFSIFCLILSIRTLFVGERFFISVFPNFPWQIHIKICYLTFLTYIYIFAVYLNEFFPGIISKNILKAYKILTITYCISILIGPIDFYEHLILPYEIISILVLVYILSKLSLQWLSNGYKSSLITLGSFAILVTNINDILYEYSIVQTGSYAALGLFIFILVQSYVMADKFSKAFNEVEALSERLKSLDKIKDQFLANTSHELRTPLNGVIGITQALLTENADNLNPEQVLNLKLINSSASRLSYLVNDILDFSKLNNNDIKLDKKPVNVRQAVDLVILTCSHAIKGKKITINNNISSELPYIIADENRVQQILYNLIGNAIKFTQYGSITIDAKVVSNYVEISIKDTGIGIPKDKLNAIFEPYEQVDFSIAKKYGGTGLGLNITKKLIEMHSGSIYVESAVGEGSKFSFILPVHNNKTVSPSALPNLLNNLLKEDSLINDFSLNNFSDSKKHRVLIVDDEEINIKVLERFLSPEGYNIITARNGAEALELLKNFTDIDLLILDLMLPDMLGYEICSLLREEYSMFQLPILMLTADNRPESLVVSFECGANDYLTKPVDKLELISRVKTLITLKESVKEALLLKEKVIDANKKVELLEDNVIKSENKLSEILEYDKLKTEFFANISHELRTPLNVIWSTLQLIEILKNNNQLEICMKKDYHGVMKQNCLRLIRLINNLIDITKIDGNYLTLELYNQNIVSVIEDIVMSVVNYAESHEITLVFDTDVEEKIMAFDSDKMERIILNLLSNAIKFTPKGGEIDVTINDLGNYIRISVKDTGVGIPKEELSNIFERFTQVDKSLSRQNEGSGIGLSLVKSLVALHEGNIYVKSEHGFGSEFIIELPARLKEDCKLKTEEYSSDSKYVDRINIEFSDIYLK